VNVLVNLKLEPEHLERIRAVSSVVSVRSVYERTGVEPATAHSYPGDVEPALQGDELHEALAEAEVLFTFRFPDEWVDQCASLKWVQLASAGADHILRGGLLDRRPNVVLTTASGIHEVPISEHILALILHFSRKLHVAVRGQARHIWEDYQADEACGKTVCLIGYGPIARRTAALCSALGMRVLCVRASIPAQEAGDGPIERFFPLRDLNAALADSHYVVVAAPRTPHSEGMIGRAQFEAMKPQAILINISRGALVDEQALIEALREGRIAGAGLDVFQEEPLPEHSPLWDMSNVLITPHKAGSTPHYGRRVTDLFCDNLSRYLRGQPLNNMVDPKRGY
jgi:phosphoglycerate dehydrogenase-like enzyme